MACDDMCDIVRGVMIRELMGEEETWGVMVDILEADTHSMEIDIEVQETGIDILAVDTHSMGIWEWVPKSPFNFH